MPKDATANMTLGEIKARDEDNARLVMSDGDEHAFDKLGQALYFVGQGINGAMAALGVDQKAIWEKAGLKPGQVKKALDSPVSVNFHQPAVIDPRIQKVVAEVDRMMKEKDVKVERRQYNAKKDLWKSGTYIYHGNEIAYFFSEPYRRKGGYYQTPHVIVPALGKWFVLTNYKVKATVH